MTEERPYVELNIELPDPDDLTDEEERLLLDLQHASEQEFEDFLRKYVAAPTESAQWVLRHPSLVLTTRDALYRLQAGVQQRAQHEQDKMMRQVHLDQVKKYGRERRAIAPFVNLAISEAAKRTSRARAEKMLGKMRYPELKAIQRDYEAGLTDREVEARYKERMGRGPRSTKT